LLSEDVMQSTKNDANSVKHARKRKCLYHPAMECPTPDKPCIFDQIEDMKRKGRNRINEYL